MTDPVTTVERFLRLMNEGRVDAGMDLLAEDVFYHNIPMEPMIGRENVRAFSPAFGLGTRLSIDWETIAICAAGNTVLTERIDRFGTPDGRTMSIALMGSFRVRDGFIAEWRDYFDLRDFERQLAVIQADAPSAARAG